MSQVAALLDRAYRRSHSVFSQRFYASGARKLAKFLAGLGYADIDAAVAKLRAGKMEAYRLLDSYVAWLDQAGLRAKTVHDYFHSAVKLLRQYDLDLRADLLREKVTLPVVEEILDEAPTPQQIRGILARAPLRLQALILVMATAGLRLAEALRLRVRDVDFTARPVRVRVRAGTTKARAERETFLSDEAVEVMKRAARPWLRNPEAPLLGFGEDLHMAEKKAIQMFRRVMRWLPDLDQPIDGAHRVHKLHLYSLRKFFFTKAVTILGETPAHALLGHRGHLLTYYRKPPEERAADYRRLMPHLRILQAATEVTPAALETRDAKIQHLEQEFAALRAQVQQLVASKAVDLARTEHLGARVLRAEQWEKMMQDPAFRARVEQWRREVEDAGRPVQSST